MIEANRSLGAIRDEAPSEQLESANCCALPGGLVSTFSWPRHSRQGSVPVESTVTVEVAARIEPPPVATGPKLPGTAAPVWGTIASVGVACFPKCPMCWAAYLSGFGITGLSQVAFSPWLQPVLVAVMLLNIGSVWLRGRSTGRLSAPWLVSAGALVIIASRMWPDWEKAALWGVALTVAGSLLSAAGAVKKGRASTRRWVFTDAVRQDGVGVKSR